MAIYVLVIYVLDAYSKILLQCKLTSLKMARHMLLQLEGVCKQNAYLCYVMFQILGELSQLFRAQHKKQ